MNDYKVWDRHALILKLCYDITGEYKEIKPAGPRESQKKFGGPLLLEEYRYSSYICDKEYRLVMPPLTTIIPMIEQDCQDGGRYSSYSKVNPETGLRLQRSKPLPSAKHSLMETMKIKKKSRTKKVV